ncbi:MAG: hypothetical protein ACNA7F_15200 [Roseovarius sp.]
MICKTLSVLTGALAAAALVAMPSATHAQEGWTGQVTLYGWGAGVGGDVTPFAGAPTLSFDKSLSEVLEDLDVAFFATALARRGDFVVFGDLTYSSSSRSGTIPPGAPASGEVTMRSLTLAAGKRFDVGQGTAVDVMGGLRGWKVEGLVSVPLAGVRIAPEQSFVDPIVALRVNTPLADRWSVLTYADMGGFGVGSDVTWQAAVTANYQATENLFLSFGYRHLYLDYKGGGTVFKGYMSGPLIGATWQF